MEIILGKVFHHKPPWGNGGGWGRGRGVGGVEGLKNKVFKRYSLLYFFRTVNILIQNILCQGRALQKC